LAPSSSLLAAEEKVFEAWSKSVNASGGVSGHPVNLITKDDQSSPGNSVTDVQSLISSHVSAILDLSLLDSIWAKAVQTAGIPVIGGNVGSDPFYQNTKFYASGETQDDTLVSMVVTAKTAGASNMGTVVCAESPECKAVESRIQSAGTKYGVPVTYTAAVAATAPNYTATCLAAKQANVNALFVGIAPAVATRFAADCSRQGYNPIYVTEGATYTAALAADASFKNNLWFTFPILPIFSSSPVVTTMNKAVDQYFPGLRNDTNSWSQLAALGWTGGLLLEKGMVGANAGSGAVSAADVTRGLETVKNEALGGWSPPLSFTSGQPHPIKCWYTAQVKNGTAVLINSGNLICPS
jgi:branched-chain amino acid transport system substrate-binding protein